MNRATRQSLRNAALAGLAALAAASCGAPATPEKTAAPAAGQPAANQPRATVDAPARGTVARLGDTIEVRYTLSPQAEADSVVATMGDIRLRFGAGEPVALPTGGARTGENNIRLAIHAGGHTAHTSTSVALLAARPPKEYGYRVVATHPHDPEAYTQGLFAHDGLLYESTGQYGQSTLRRGRLGSADPLALTALPDDDFGEGITLLGDKIVMLTWESRRGYVIDARSLQIAHEFPLDGEGWGITTMGNQLIMSDGSHRLTLLSPDHYTPTGVIEVYDDRGPVRRLNELEHRDGLVWANVYGSDHIVAIDPRSGQVAARADLAGLLTPAQARRHRVDVLNGIAWDGDRMLVTGKLWPAIFEIELVEK